MSWRVFCIAYIKRFSWKQIHYHTGVPPPPRAESFRSIASCFSPVHRILLFYTDKWCTVARGSIWTFSQSVAFCVVTSVELTEGYVIISVLLFVCYQDNSKTREWIEMKLFGRINNGTRKKLNFWGRSGVLEGTNVLKTRCNNEILLWHAGRIA